MISWLKKIFGIERLTEQVELISKDLKYISKSNLKQIETNDNFDIRDIILDVKIFEFEKLKFNEEEKILVDKKPNRILQAIGSVPEFLEGGILSQSFKFKFPQGISGEVMNIGQGKGTAIFSNGKIISHGTYISNILTSAPLIAYSAVNFVIKQHYLAKINENLDKINENLSYLINIEFIKKEAKIESMIIFFQRCEDNFKMIENNEDYKSALLSNIIQNNNSIRELIYFYMKSFNSSSHKNPEELQNVLKYFFLLKELSIVGKLLEFKFANEFNSILVENLKSDFDSTVNLYQEFLIENKSKIKETTSKIDFNLLDNKWLFGSFIGSKQKKENNLQTLNYSDNIIDKFLEINNERNIDIKNTLSNFVSNLKEPQSFIIENGKLYKQKKYKKIIY